MSSRFTAPCSNETSFSPPEIVVPIASLFFFNAALMLGFFVALLWKRLKAPLYFVIVALMVVCFSLRGAVMIVFSFDSKGLAAYVLNTLSLILPTLPLVLFLIKWISATHESFEHSETSIRIVRIIVYTFTTVMILIFLALRIVFGVLCFGAGGIRDTVGTVFYDPGLFVHFFVYLVLNCIVLVAAASSFFFVSALIVQGSLFLIYGVILVRKLYLKRNPDFVMTLFVSIAISLSYFL